MKTFHLHLISDSTGETVSSVARSVMSQFEDVEPEEHIWSLVRTSGQMNRVIASIKENPGIVLYTIVSEELQRPLREACKELKIPYVPVLSRVTREISSYLGVEATAEAGRQHELDEEYFQRVEAIHFTLAHDDGQMADDLEEADIVLVGVSRTSKTPTCVYLSYRGLNVANVPYVMGCPLPDNINSLKHPLVVGLVISPDRLIQIRKSRLLSLHENRDTSYVDMDNIKEEVLEARRLFSKNNWPVIDVTRKSVEETSATIMQLYNRFLEGK